MKKVLIILFSVVCSITTFAQQSDTTNSATDTTKIWRFNGLGSVNFSQVQLNNWSAGGENSISGTGLLNLHLHYNKKKHSWKNDLELAYGLIKQGEDKIIKSDDKIDFSSKYGLKASKSWKYSAMTSFKTQFTEGYDYPNDSIKISDFMAPAYLITSLGMDYNPNDIITIFLSPITAKMTIVNDDSLADKGAFGVEATVYDTSGNLLSEAKKQRYEFGGYIKFVINKELMKNISLQSKLELFSNYVENPQNIDVNWETLLNLKVNEYISANISTNLIYDDDIKIAVNKDGETEKLAPRTQFKEVFSVGLAYKF